MVDRAVVEAVHQYMRVLDAEGIPVAFSVLYGSFARGEEHEWSDIDLMVVSPLFDNAEHWSDTERLWTATVYTDSRIEPIGVGVRQWEEDDRLPIIEIARREGQIIYPHQ
ncbi:MAG: nucleotidyltransferase domain-containing protein [Magnetococcus sp. THC-1_WYH]